MKIHKLFCLLSLITFSLACAAQEADSTKNNKLKIITFMEQMPEFPGGTEKLMIFIKKELKYPQEAYKNGVQGRVYVQFIVDIDGSIIDVKVIRGVDQLLDEEAIRIIKLMPKWKPGKQNGTPVKVSMTVPVTFKIDKD